jgi:hypothetical protein
MQQARDLRAEETVEVVRNHEDGTGFRRWLSGTEAHGDVGGSGRSAAVTRIVSAMRGRWRGGGARFGPAAKAVVFGARAHESHERRSGVRPGQQESSEGEPRPEGPHGSIRRKVGGLGAAPSEHLEGRRGNAQGQGGGGEGRPNRYDHAADIATPSVSDGGVPGP